jgi:hypothetical protein
MRKGVLVLLVVGAVPAAAAQEGFREWAQSQRQEFREFREQRDKEFHQFLKAQWQAFRVYQGEAEDTAPKPRTVPKAPPEPAPEPDVAVQPQAEPEPEPGPEPGPQPAPEPAPEPRAEPEPRPTPEPAPAPPAGEQVAVAFLGHDLTVRVPAAWRDLDLGRANQQAVADFWAAFASEPADPVVSQLQAIRDRLRLNGWSYLRLTHALAQAMQGEGNAAVATTWALLLKSGLDARVGYQNGDLFLLYRPQEKLYDTPYFDLDGKRYYVYQPGDRVPRLVTYEADYQGADERLAIALTRPPKAGGASRTKTLRFRYQGQRYRVEVPVSPALLEHLSTVPQMGLPAYFRTQPSPGLAEALVKPMKAATEGLSRQQQVNLLLRFVQTAFEYQTDQEQFGREDYLFPEETVFYPASDCEDRSVLFAWLVRRVLGLEVAVLDYPGHVATALDVGNNGKGVHVTVSGRRLLVADPTYINANAGMVMPDFRDKRPKVVPLWEG